jgi:LuxR family transcriptional regulator, maltose regulon positive regulatory protein
VAAFTGSHRYVLDYLTEEVLARQAEPLVGFLLETSVLARLSGPLCDAVTGRGDSQALLESIERANLFLVPLDEERGWWRYHRLFADLLQARLQQTRPDRVARLHHNAAAWCQRHGLVDEAIHHALAAGEAEWAARMMEQHTRARFQRGEGATVDRWLAALPAGLIRARPRLCLAAAIWALIGGRVDEVEPLLADAERADAGGVPVEEPAVGDANVPAMLAILRAELARQHGDPDRTIKFAQRALPHVGEDDQLLRYLVGWNLAVAALMQGRVADAGPALAEVAADRWLAGDPYNALRACYTLSQVQRTQGRLGAAFATCREALERAAAGQPLAPATGVAHIGLAEVLRERGELDEALRHASEGVALCRQLPYAQWQVTSLAALAWIRQARGDQTGAMEAIGEAEQVLPRREVVADLIFPVAVQRARLRLAEGDVGAAARWVRERGLGPEDEPSFAREREYLVLARVLLAEQTPERALPLLERLHAAAMAQGRTGSVIEVRALQALALAAGADRASAVEALAEALALAWPEGYLRVFVDEGGPMATLLWTLRTPGTTRPPPVREIAPDYLRRLTEAFEQGEVAVSGRGRRGAAPGLVEPLSDRELEVLGLLAAGKPNRQIAEELVVALDTVKKHVSHLLDKLGVDNRTQAVTRARELGLIP